MSKLKGAVTVITGASSGIGAATAIKIASLGGVVVLAARNEEKLQAIVTQIKEAGGEASYHITDVSKRESLQSLVQFAEATYGKVDALVNNAGLMLFSDWKDVAIDDWEKMISTNIQGYLNAIAAVLPKMLDQGHGKILNMSSVAGLHVGASSGVYSATKFFIRGITESLRKEVGVQNGIQVSMISPGVIDTGWADKVNDEAGREAAQKLNEIAITPEQIADAVAYALDQPANLTVNDIVIHPTKQDW
ncbi:SDR family oxidoreductase [Pseudomonas sp. CNPSo 3701]|uniref:SDR family oxidoreductase n=1 Tax=Pseudomonas sp. CNPSo 3701 TaxID=3027943 RepID=UPI002363F224|nr:SDR family oxidoreductase [Pseudomonas sp. CNPSo 3701]MDD1507700.1 SDR family oxidoreductase [Pseudomonas sp. CNPSo 3701]